MYVDDLSSLLQCGWSGVTTSQPKRKGPCAHFAGAASGFLDVAAERASGAGKQHDTRGNHGHGPERDRADRRFHAQRPRYPAARACRRSFHEADTCTNERPGDAS